jgi:myo-inositol-1(or 4)-monophosphatase
MKDFVNLQEYIFLAKGIAISAGRLLKKRINLANKISYKGRVNLVTEADLASEKFIINKIEKAYPSHSILAEEGAAKNKNSAFKWVIDPLDGTTNFAHRFPFYCVSIALEYKKEIVVGVVYDPERRELFYAAKNGGAYLNDRKIRVSCETELSRALLATGFPYDIGTSSEDNLGHFVRLAKLARGIRRAGSAALDLCYLACGRIDGFWELKLSPWDTAAGKLIVEEAGGRVTDFRGKKYSIYGKYIVAGNARICSQLRRALNFNN